MKHTVDFNYFPGYTRKAITFTLDDGNVRYDRALLDVVRPAGIRGTFNLCSTDALSPEEYRSLYKGYEIANHVHRHPEAIGERFDSFARVSVPYPAEGAQAGVLYATDTEGLYRFVNRRGRPQYVAEVEPYMTLTDRATELLRAVFGPSAAQGFVWPYSEQPNEELKARLRTHGFAYMRKTGSVLASTGFAMPLDRMAWSYNADDAQLLACAEDFAAYPDDGELKFFAFGVHAVDFEAHARWDDLRSFCERFGNRPDEYYSAPVIDLFRYEDAVYALRITDEGIENASDICLFGTVDGERVTLPAHGKLVFS